MSHAIDDPQLTPQQLQAVVDVVAAGARIIGVHVLAGSFSNHSCRVELKGPDGARSQIVVRRYAEHGEAPRRKAIREFEALRLLHEHGEVPCPEPLLLDADGTLLGSPGIVTGFVDGEHAPLEHAARPWTRRCRAAAVTLARIHDVAVGPRDWEWLMDANTEALWFVAADVPDYMVRHPDGAALWHAVRDRRPHVVAVEPTLVHVDYWSGNLLWNGDDVSAVVDWEEAGVGDPAIDVAYCLMELALEGLDEDAVAFLATYLDASGRALPELAFWKLAAAARPMLDLDGWLTRPHMAERFRTFIGRALEEVGSRSGSALDQAIVCPPRGSNPEPMD